MGHVHVGRIPKTQLWIGVIRALRAPTLDARTVAVMTTESATDRLERLRSDPNLATSFWMLSRLASAAKRPNFAEALTHLGVRVAPNDTAISVISRIADRAGEELERRPGSGPFGELAILALRRTLTETVGRQGTLFESSIDDVQDAFARYATPKRFGELAHRFFGDLMARTLRFYVDKELSLCVGHGWPLTTSTQAIAFTTDLERYARESARIVEAFAADWFSLHDWQAGGSIAREEAQGFVAEAMRKLRDDLMELPA